MEDEIEDLKSHVKELESALADVRADRDKYLDALTDIAHTAKDATR